VQQVRSLSLQMFLLDNGDQNLSVGSSGENVWALQVYLIMNNILSPTGAAGSKLTNPTNYFGVLTQGALAAYQANVGITPASGMLGAKTRAYLQSLVGGATTSVVSTPVVSTPSQAVTSTATTTTPPVSTTPAATSLSFGSKGTKVVALQNALIIGGYLQAGVFTYATFDAATLRAVETFQCSQNITCSGPSYGIVGAKTAAALGL
jgi:peptidoglycan hydrolase-like protein with peptidoglycan-binding domain